jgi:hypothetical protein
MPIESGYEICLTTIDPDNLSLLSWEPLEMQWFLNRVLAISAATDVKDSYSDGDDNNDIFLKQEQDFGMFDTLDSEDKQLLFPADSQS